MREEGQGRGDGPRRLVREAEENVVLDGGVGDPGLLGDVGGLATHNETALGLGHLAQHGLEEGGLA